MDNLTRSVLKSKIESLKATYFQDALDKIFMTIYGESFDRIKQKQDKGSDGILHGTTIIAAYAPERITLQDFKKKIKGDYESYEKNWSATHPNWLVVCNGEITASMKMFVHGLKSDAKTMCIEELIELIRQQTWSKSKLIFQSLDMPDVFISNDIFKDVIEDLIHNNASSIAPIPYDKPTYIEEKAQINLEPENLETFLDEYEEYLVYFNAIKEIVKSRSTSDVTALRSKIRSAYSIQEGTFSQKLNSTCEYLASEKVRDHEYLHHLRVTLVYFFEQCLFGYKTESEKGHV